MNKQFLSCVRVCVALFELLMLNRFLYGIWMKTANIFDDYDTLTMVLPFLMVTVLVAYLFACKRLTK